MASPHPDSETLWRFLRGETSRDETRAIVPHLVAGCPRCLLITREAWLAAGRGPCELRGSRPPFPIHPSSYAGLWEKAMRAGKDLEALREEDLDQARTLLRELRAVPSGERLAHLCGDRRFRSLALCRSLAAESLRCGDGKPHLAEELAELAVAAAQELSAVPFGEAAVADARAGAWCALAGARRRRGDLEGAERALRVAEALLRKGSGDPLERAELLLCKAALAREQRRFEGALALLGTAERTHGGLGDDHFVGRLRVEEARVRTWAGDPEGVLESLRQALSHLDPPRDPGLVLAVTADLAHRLLDLGRRREARKWYRRACRLAEEGEDRRLQLSLTRLGGRLALAQGRVEEAEGSLSEAWARLAAAGLGDEAALALLDLAALHARRSDRGELGRLAERISVALTVTEKGTDGRLALELLGCAAERGRATAGLVAQLAAHVARTHPSGW